MLIILLGQLVAKLGYLVHFAFLTILSRGVPRF